MVGGAGGALADPLAGPPIISWRLVRHREAGKCGSQPVRGLLACTSGDVGHDGSPDLRAGWDPHFPAYLWEFTSKLGSTSSPDLQVRIHIFQLTSGNLPADLLTS